MKLVLSIDPPDASRLQRLPWHKPLERWNKRDARFLEIRSGISRHVVRFIRIRGCAYAVKETTPEIAERESDSYLKLRALGIPALKPVGTVIREEGLVATTTRSVPQLAMRGTGYLITSLLEFSLPNSHLFRLAFRKENRRRIWDAIVRLFVQLHCKGVYWGDASLSNMMITFLNRRFPEIGIRTVLGAVLADAETVEFIPPGAGNLSERLRRADIDYFLESMAWTEADMKASGIIREPLMTKEDQEYVLGRYLDLFEIEREEQTFGLITNIDVDSLLGPFERRGQSKALLQHIYEHKWYLSEREGHEIPVTEAARDWYVNVFKPVLMFFSAFRILDDFPERTASSLYLDIMLHKYYLSEKVGRDVGLRASFEEYVRQFKDNARTMEKMSGLMRSIEELVGRK